eukprot:TRINITY_DN11342_c0_g1_i1.p1 TRINITY_DN11342_c0_g1~~TRINITY_DN11342_c0_g1_i1.p1  ORF type:complete len:265 (-),score=39.15 TRINITY_DN11342_c0_g1_i1:7-690(-)
MDANVITVIVISDTHTEHAELNRFLPKQADLLIHCGDFTEHGVAEHVTDFNKWLGTLPYQHKIVISGNHEVCFDNLRDTPDLIQKQMTNCTYLQDESLTLFKDRLPGYPGLTLYGTPWVGRQKIMVHNRLRGIMSHFFGLAFALYSHSDELRIKREAIPQNIDWLITHPPPEGVLDGYSGKAMGCHFLSEIIYKNRLQINLEPNDEKEEPKKAVSYTHLTLPTNREV